MLTAWMIIYGCLLTVIFAIPFILAGKNEERRKKYDLFTPDKIAAVFHAIKTLPFFFFAGFNIDSWLAIEVQQHSSIKNINTSIAIYGAMEILGFLSLLAGMYWRKPKSVGVDHNRNKTQTTGKHLFWAGLVFWLIGAALYIDFINEVGGLFEAYANLHKRREFTAERGYIHSIYTNMITIGVFSVAMSFKDKKGFAYLITSVFLVVCSVAIFTSTGGRSQTVGLLLGILVCWNYGVRRIKIQNKSLVVIVIFVIIYIVSVPILRTSGGFEKMTSDIDTARKDVADNMKEILQGNKYVETQIFIMAHFNLDNIWLGRTFISILYAPIPRKYYADKPPLDDGVIIHTLLMGYNAHSNMSMRQLSASSWPPGTMGTMFMNFWYPGVIVGMFLLGVIYQYTFRRLIRKECSIAALAIYILVVWRFQLSTLNIVNTITGLAIILVFHVTFLGRRMKTVTV